MAEPIIVPTPFTELGELAEHFAQRVDQGRLMLPFSEGVPDGEWVPFQVLYLDGSVAMEGTGKVNGSYDNGDESPPEYRFDVVLEELAFDGTSEVVFERITVARTSMLAAEPATGEVSLAEVDRTGQGREPFDHTVMPVGRQADRRRAEPHDGLVAARRRLGRIGSADDSHREGRVGADMEERFGVDEDGQRTGGGFGEEIGTDLPAMEMAGERCPVEDLLRSRHLDRRRAVELQRSSRGVDDEIAAENTVGGRIDGGEEPEGQRRVVVVHRSPMPSPAVRRSFRGSSAADPQGTVSPPAPCIG